MTSTAENHDLPAPPYDLIELLFFAYRDFTSDPDDVLTQYDFGRAHHRVLHFVDRNPDIMVTDLLAILRITKQSLGRVLKQLVDEDFIEQRPGANDRRQRLLRTTEKGQALALRLAELQTRRLNAALAGLSHQEQAAARKFLFQMIDSDVRPDVAKLLKSSDPNLAAGGPPADGLIDLEKD
ncbi:MarR family winged helix-turn-helix transcriptional regulator [Roseibium sp. RKSG952]|uniref:MarR family winged helix-turn-helix transcriptional regulator n=1 Tax=Roseibium sp. RKSG952 TaxID=2529384 RepID=UPI0012BD2414|nr:MarR family winged helix-turn-helix transcriptional regulator [Roseibium sp. RKSG952]MTH98153.1 MarR family transcriptional regulator [Roseibium sp. RKSG952]